MTSHTKGRLRRSRRRQYEGLSISAIIALLCTLGLSGQTPSTAPSISDNLAQGRVVFAARCAGCHGADALGTDRAPKLVGSRSVSQRSTFRLRELIQNGIQGTGMPAFDLSPNELDAIVALVHSFNWQAADSNVPGDSVAGERFFFGQGQCASCHMVAGKGKPIGPDLSNIGREKTVDELQTAMLHPKPHATPGYDLVTVKLRSGQTIRGFARGRSNFDIRLEDLDGNFNVFQQAEISSIEDEQQSWMPPFPADSPELPNLIAYLSRQTGVKTEPIANTGEHTGIEFSDILHPKPGEWPSYNGKLSGNRYSELNQINGTNVNKLVVKWIFTVPLWKQLVPDTPYFVENMKYFGLETTPIVANDTMYVTGPHQAFALDARTGREIWEYSRLRTPGLVGDASVGTNKGAAVLGDKVFLVTDNAHLLALNRTTGQVVWEAVMPDEPQHYGSTVAPLIVKDLVIVGVSGGDWGLRGFISAYKASTGERVWRFWTVPAAGEPGSETWKGKEPTLGGGSTWVTGTYDPETDTLYWPTATPFPNTDGRSRPGDNLFTECILALNPDTGKLKWYYQFTPHDVHVWDATETPVLIDTLYRGQDRKLLLLANRNGFFYVLDRTNGNILLAKSFMKHLTWASGIGADGRPQLLPEGDMTCPEDATNWNAAAFSPLTHLYYVMADEKCVVKLSPGKFKEERPQAEPGKRYLRALDIETGKTVWEDPQVGTIEGKRKAGVLATAGGVLFYGDPTGDFVAVDERNGKTLWHFTTNGENKASPMTYMAAGQQFIVIAIGPNIVCFGLP